MTCAFLFPFMPLLEHPLQYQRTTRLTFYGGEPGHGPPVD